jgi:hypothetical protein
MACRIVLELRVTATDDDAWRKFGRYFRLIGPFSHMLRKQMLGALQKQLGTLEDAESTRALPGDELIAEPKAESTDAITIEAPPEKVFPWLVQMGGGRAGWYSYDRLDNDGVPSAREIVPALQPLRPGDVLPFFAGSDDGFVVDRIEAPHTLVLSAGMDLAKRRSILPGEPLPARYFRSTWAFLLEPYGSGATRLLVRARVDFRPSRLRLRAWWMSKVHAVMETEQLRNLKRRAEGALPRETLSEMTEGVEGAFRIIASLATPFRRGERLHEGLTEAEANGVFPGDGRVPSPRFTWTHAVEVDAPPAEVWPWVVQIGQDRAGFYSYQALENVAGCDLVNADRIHPEWQQRKAGDLLKLHAGVPPMTIVQIEEGRYLVAQIHTVEGDRYANVSWMFQVEPLPGRRSRVVSRFRSSTSDDIAHRLLFGPYLVEAVGGVMDRRMLRGIKERVERARSPLHLAPPVPH